MQETYYSYSLPFDKKVNLPLREWNAMFFLWLKYNSDVAVTSNKLKVINSFKNVEKRWSHMPLLSNKNNKTGQKQENKTTKISE